jgi:hypothetical protein
MATGVMQMPTGVTQIGIGVMRAAMVVMQTSMAMAPAGVGVSHSEVEETQIPAVVGAKRSGALRRRTAMLPERRWMLPRRSGVSPGGRRVGRAGLAVGRGTLAFSDGLDAEAPFLDQLLENPVEGAAVRLVAERLADVAARERLGKAWQHPAEVVLQLSDAPAPGAAW